MASIKISYDREIRRVPLREDGSVFTLTKLMNTLYNLFPALTGKSFSLTWEDEEGDEVVCSSDAELDDAIHVMRAMGKVLRFTVKLNDTASTAEVPKTAPERINFVHANVTCDECGVKPIVGIRYKCAIRNDFDLCETCEAKRIQPYPMIKIVDPAQAPQVLVYGLPDGTRNDEGAFWQRGWRHPHHPPHHPHHPPHGPPHGPPPPFGGPHPGRGGPFPHPHGPGPFGGRGHPFAEGLGHCRRRCDRWARKFAENVAKEAAPFVAAMDQVFGAEAVPSAEATPAPATNNSEDAQLEEQLIEKAILESLSINESQKPVAETPVNPTAPSQTAAPVNTYVETAKPANPTLPKPALRFVKDVTFPDGTIVQPGAKFRKAWKVRNDGSHAWPSGAALVSVGGDVMGDPALKEALPSLAPEKEAEIAVQLTAPQAPGMYTAYYRAQTKEQQYFGQRLWASIVVADQEPEWQVVTENASSTTATSPTPSVPAVPVVTSPVPVPVVEKPVTEPVLPVSEPLSAATTPALPAAPTPVAPAPVVLGTSTAAPVAPVEVPTAPAPTHLRSAILLWRRELEVLNEMGFSDPEMVLPLLTQHLGSPVSLSGDKNARPNAEGMQQVIATLLSLSN